MARRKKRRRIAATKIKSLIGQAAISHQRKRKTMPTLERMLKAGKITTEQFWCGNRFAAAYEAEESGPGVAANDFEPRSRGAGAQPTYPAALALAKEYREVWKALQERFGRIRGTNMLSLMTLVFGRGLTLEQADLALKQRKGTASTEVCAGLQFLESHYAYELSMERRAAVRVERLPAKYRATA
jgi:hypothetical protein